MDFLILEKRPFKSHFKLMKLPKKKLFLTRSLMEDNIV